MTRWKLAYDSPGPLWLRTTWELAFIFEPRDLWVGMYVDRPRRYDPDDWYWAGIDQDQRYQVGGLTSIYCMLLPMLGLRLRIRWRDRALPTESLE